MNPCYWSIFCDYRLDVLAIGILFLIAGLWIGKIFSTRPLNEKELESVKTDPDYLPAQFDTRP